MLPFGAVQGNELQEVDEYLGIPYAPKPGRFQRSAPWTEGYPGEYLKATAYTPMCMQSFSPLNVPLAAGASEDCLHLNVYSPRLEPPTAAGWPTMVWIHGGAFTSGSAMGFNATDLCARERVVVALINYRLNVFGFGVVETGDGAFVANLGIHDQQQALRWVRKHIGAFRGASLVTIFGESAGGGSVTMHMVSPRSAGLFDRAIAQSAGMDDFTTLAGALSVLASVSKQVGCGGSPDAACLRRASAETLVNASASLEWSPVVDGDLLEAFPPEQISRGLFNRVPFVLGTNLQEGNLFGLPPVGLSGHPGRLTAQEVACIFTSRFGEEVGRGLLELYAPVAGAENRQSYADLFGDLVFQCPARATAQALVAAGAGPWVYSFRRHSTCSGYLHGPTHGEEVPFVFRSAEAFKFNISGDDIGLAHCKFGPKDRELQARISGLWAGFARTGRMPESWPRWSGSGEPALKLNLGTLLGLKLTWGYRQGHCEGLKAMGLTDQHVLYDEAMMRAIDRCQGNRSATDRTSLVV